MIALKKGLDLPIAGAPKQEIAEEKKVKRYAVVGTDFIGMKPTMKVEVGDNVKKGQLLFTNKKMEGIDFTSPVCGVVKEINRGERRAFQSVVIEKTGEDHVLLKSFLGKHPKDLSREEIALLLRESGEWAAMRARPFGKTANPEEKPFSIFVNAMDTNPLAANPDLILEQKWEHFLNGLAAIRKLTDGKVYCVFAADSVFLNRLTADDQIVVESFKGPHPAGNTGTHMHFLSPVTREKQAWSIGYQDLIAWGSLFQSGKIDTERVIAIGGPRAKNPRLVKTHRGADLATLLEGEINQTDRPVRVVSGSVFNGKRAEGPFGYLGRYDVQVSVLQEGREREFLGWHAPGFDKFSLKNVFFSKLTGKKKFEFDTSKHGSLRSIVPVGSFERVMPLDILPTYLLRALAAKDTEKAQELGALELVEEDLALCIFADPCKNEFDHLLRENLTQIEIEG